MGYANYDTPRGPAGYVVKDVCHQDNCSEAIDRGLTYLCGASPGVEDEVGCGRWFCASHLYGGPTSHPEVQGLCKACSDRYDEAA